MSGLKTVTTEVRNLEELKPLLSAKGWCASVYVTLKAASKTNILNWRETVRPLEAKLEEAGADGRTVWETLNGWGPPLPDEAGHHKGLAVFCSTTGITFARLANEIHNRAVAGPCCFVRPLLAELEKAKDFYILALSQKDVRLLHCDASSAREVALPAETISGFDAYMNTAKPDHVRTNTTTAGHSGGHNKGIVGSTDTERENKPEYLTHFFQQIDKGVNHLLHGSNERVVPAGVEYVLAQYRSINKYPHLSEEGVQGTPNGLKAGEMHARALEALARERGTQTERVLAEYEHKAGGGASNRLKDIVAAAHDGRIVALMISDSLENQGVFDEETHAAKGGDSGGAEEQDLVNDAAVQTLLHAGQVYTVSNKKMPNGAPAVAIFRY